MTFRKKQIFIFAYTKQGVQTARKTALSFKDRTRDRQDGAVPSETPDFKVFLYTTSRVREEIQKLWGEEYAMLQVMEQPSDHFYGQCFSKADALIFVGAAGIAVRSIAPFVRDKRTDPAVLCLDELGHFVIPLLSGHIGGANALANRIASSLGAVPVITTATDIHGRFSVDSWASRNQLQIDDMRLAKEISREILERDLPFYSEFPVTGSYPQGTYPWDPSNPEVRMEAGAKEPERLPDLGISVGIHTYEPFAAALRLIPRVLHLGIGCRKGISQEAVSRAVSKILSQWQLDPRAIRGVYSIDLKAKEPGLTAYCERENLPFAVYSAEELKEVPGTFSSSSFVESVTGVDNVCERAALREADRLLVSKTAAEGVTVAIATENLTLSF